MSSVMPPSRRQRNKARVKAALVAATVKLAVARGFERTSVAEITALAGVAKGTFFNYFPTKEAVIEERYDELFGQAMAIVGTTPPGPPRRWFRAVFRRMARALARERRIVQLVLGEAGRIEGVVAKERAAYAKLHRAYVAALGRGERTASADRAARVLQTVWSGAVQEWASAPGMNLEAELVRRVDLVFRGIEV
jgi:AcrR family transcriptional regulator